MGVELPAIKRVEGRLRNVKVRGLYRRGTAYEFAVDGQSMWFCTGPKSGSVGDPFLAEGDRVVLAVLDAPLTPGGERRVYALQNCEDDCVYVAHFIWQGSSASYGGTRIAPGSEHRYAVALGVFLGVLFGVGCGFSAATGIKSWPWSFAGGVCVGVWLVVVVPLYVIRWRWGAGFPTRRQRVLDGVYRCLGLESPLVPSRRVRAV
jgi:hypothetical protein